MGSKKLANLSRFSEDTSLKNGRFDNSSRDTKVSTSIQPTTTRPGKILVDPLIRGLDQFSPSHRVAEVKANPMIPNSTGRDFISDN